MENKEKMRSFESWISSMKARNTVVKLEDFLASQKVTFSVHLIDITWQPMFTVGFT